MACLLINNAPAMNRIARPPQDQCATGLLGSLPYTAFYPDLHRRICKGLSNLSQNIEKQAVYRLPTQLRTELCNDIDVWLFE